jgi:hypothetical protein
MAFSPFPPPAQRRGGTPYLEHHNRHSRSDRKEWGNRVRSRSLVRSAVLAPFTRGKLLSYISKMQDEPQQSPRNCRQCAGLLKPLVTIPDKPEKYEQDHARTIYFQCMFCEHVEILDR